MQAAERLSRRPAGFAARVGQAIGAGAAGLLVLSTLTEEVSSLSSAGRRASPEDS